MSRSRSVTRGSKLCGPEAVYTIHQIAEALGLCTKTVRREIERGALKAIRVGRQLRITSSAYGVYLHDRTHNI